MWTVDPGIMKNRPQGYTTSEVVLGSTRNFTTRWISDPVAQGAAGKAHPDPWGGKLLSEGLKSNLGTRHWMQATALGSRDLEVTERAYP